MEFLSEVRISLEKRLSSDARLTIQAMPRNNGTSYDGLIIMRPNCNISPTIYLTPYYHRYLDGVALEDIYADILSTYESCLPECDFDIREFTDWSKASPKIIMRLVNYQGNQKLLSDVPHIVFQDLAVVFYCMLYADKENQASILVHNEHMKMWGIELAELHLLAKMNTPKLLPYEVTPMSEVVATGSGSSTECDELQPMYIVTNSYHTNGAAVMLYDGLLEELATVLQADLLIIPSSIHEIIIMPFEEHSNLYEFTQMIREVNETQLADEEILSDHAYFYDRRKRSVAY